MNILGLSGIHWAYSGAALAAIFGGIGSSIGITYAARISSGILSEEPGKFGPLLPVVAIAGTQGIYGFITAILVIIFFNLLTGGGAKLSSAVGFQIFLACTPVALNGLISGIYQGLTAAGSAGMVAKRTGEAGRALILPALVETYAVLSLILTILLLLAIKAKV